MRYLTLSFDNGPDPDVTPRVLDVLAERGILTTFFVIGEKLAEPSRRRVAERAFAEGHWIGNHTYSHSVPLGLKSGQDVAQEEIQRTQEVVGELSHPERLFRPFGGGGALNECLLKPSVIDYLVSGAYTCVLWNAVPRDWDDPVGWISRGIEQCLAQDWTLMVIHDLPTGAMDHLEGFLKRTEVEGIRIRQDFPPDCVPIKSGRIVCSLAPYVSNLV